MPKKKVTAKKTTRPRDEDFAMTAFRVVEQATSERLAPKKTAGTGNR